MPGPRREVIGLAQQVAEMARADADLFSVTRLACSLVDQACGAGAIDMAQTVLPRDGAGHRQQLGAMRAVARRGRREICLTFEQAGELGIRLAEAVVNRSLAKQHDLQVQWQRLRLETEDMAA